MKFSDGGISNGTKVTQKKTGKLTGFPRLNANRFSGGARCSWNKTYAIREQSLDSTRLENLIPVDACFWLSHFGET